MNSKKYIKILLLYFLLSIIYFIKPLIEGKVFAAGDALIEVLPLKYFYKYEFIKNGLNLWIPYFFLGMPFVGLLQTGAFYPLNFIYFFLSVPYAFNFLFLLHYALAALFTFLYLKEIGIKDYPAFIGGFLFGYSGFLILQKTHITVVNTSIWLPLILFLYEKLRKKMNIKWSIILSCVLAIQIFAGHFQMFFYSSIFVMCYILFLTFKIKKNKRKEFIFLSILPFILSIFLSLPQLLSTYKLMLHSVRADFPYEVFTQGALRPYFIIQSISPFIFGGGYAGKYWGPQFLKTTSWFISSLAFILSFFTLLKIRDKEHYILFFGITAIIFLILAFGKFTPIYKYLYHLPIYNKFRGASKHLLEYTLCVVVIFSYGLENILYNKEKNYLYDFLKFFIGVILGFILTLFFLSTFLLDNKFQIPIFISKSNKILLKYFSISLKNNAFIIPFTFMTLYIIIFIFIKLKRSLAMFFLFVIIFLESYSFGYFHEKELLRFKLGDIPKILVEKPNKYFLHYLRKDKSLFRTLIVDEGNLFPLFNIFGRISYLNGYDPLIINSFYKLLDIRKNGIANFKLILNNILISLLNVKYIIIKKDLEKSVESITYIDDLKRSTVIEIPDILNLQSKKQDTPYKIQRKIKIKPNTFYLLSAEVKGKANGAFTIDLFKWRPHYDNKEQQMWIPAKKIKNDSFTLFFKIINTGENAPEEVWLRIITYSTTPLEVKNIKLIELGTKYLPFSLHNQSNKRWKKVYKKEREFEEYILYRNTNYLPRVFFVKKIHPVKSLNEIKKMFYAFEVNPYTTALLFEKDYNKLKHKKFFTGKAKILNYSPNKIVIKTENNNVGFLVLSDQFYPGWKAYIDSKETEIYKVNGLLRGIEVPTGTHIVEFRFEPKVLYLSLILSASVWLFMIIFLFIVSSNKNNKKVYP